LKIFDQFQAVGGFEGNVGDDNVRPGGGDFLQSFMSVLGLAANGQIILALD